MPPLVYFRFACDENLTDQRLESLCQGSVRNVALVLVELARREKPTRRHKRLVQLVHDRGFADARITRYEDELRCTLSDDPVEGREQGVDLSLPPVQLLRDQQPARRVVHTQREFIDATMRLPFRQAPSKISFQPGSGLVSLLGVLGEELHGDSRQRLGDCGSINRWYRLARNVAMDPLQRVGRGERKRDREHLVKDDAQRVEIAAGISRAIHAASLLGCHIGERTGNNLGRYGRLALARQLGRDPESGEPDVAVVVDQNVCRLDVLMDEAMPMDLADCCCQADGDAQEMRQIERSPLVPLKNQIEELTARVLKY